VKVNINNRVLELLDGDLTEMDTDAVVNAANAQLILGGGVAGAIKRKGGPEIQAECNKIGGTFVGGAEIMLKTTIEYLQGQTGLEKVVFCLFGRDSYEVFAKQLEKETSQ
jgi:O-acetyl-ADP-ribose deacetylase (regulator of RNase III)